MKIILAFIKTYWVILGMFGTLSVVVSGATYWFVINQYKTSVAYKNAKTAEIEFRSIATDLKTIKADNKILKEGQRKQAEVLQCVSEKCLTTEEFKRYYHPVLSFDPDTSKKKEILYLNYCKLYKDTSVFIYLTNI